MNKEDILLYGFHDENQKYIVRLNVEKLKEIFECDEIIIEDETKSKGVEVWQN